MRGRSLRREGKGATGRRSAATLTSPSTCRDMLRVPVVPHRAASRIEQELRVSDPDLLAAMTVQGKTPKLDTIVEIDEVNMHCARAFLRSGLWQPETWPNPNTIPTLRAICAEQKDLPPPDESQGKRQEEYRFTLY